MEGEGRPFVSLAKVRPDPDNHAEVRRTLMAQLDSLGTRIRLGPDALVLIKVNLCLLLGHETGATNDPQVVRWFCEWLIRERRVRKIYLAEADATHLSAEMAFRALGWRRFFSDLPQVEFLNLSLDERRAVATGGTFLKSLEMSRQFLEADCLVSFAKLKTHTTAKLTCIMKNQFGSIPEKYKVRYHHRLPEAICDATMARKPDLCVVDGLVAMEGYGPINGIPRRCGLLIVGNDPVAVDHACARIIGFSPERVPHLREARRRGMSGFDYEVLGEAGELKSLRFKFVPVWKTAAKGMIDLFRKERRSSLYHEAF